MIHCERCSSGPAINHEGGFPGTSRRVGVVYPVFLERGMEATGVCDRKDKMMPPDWPVLGLGVWSRSGIGQ